MTRTQASRPTLALLLCLVFSVFVYWRWFFTDWLFTWGDWGFYFRETMSAWLTAPQIWNWTGLGGVDLSLSQYITVRAIYGILSFFLFFPQVDRVVFLFPSVLVSSLSIFLLSYYLSRSTLASIASYLVFNFNTYILLLRTGHLTLAVAYGLAPLVLLLFIITLRRLSVRWAILTGLVSFLATSYEIRVFVVIGMILGLYFFIHLLLFTRGDKKKTIFTTILAGLPLLILFGLNAFWILGFFQLDSLIPSAIYQRQLFGEGHMDIMKAFTLFHPFWTGGRELAFQPQIIPAWFWLTPTVAFLGYWWNRKNKHVLFFALVALVGIFLVKQSGQPFTGVYSWLYYHLPGFGIFRESSKFYLMVAVGYSILFGFFTKAVWENKRGFPRLVKIFLLVVPLLLFVSNIKPVITGDLAKLLTPRHVPSDYLILKDFIQSQPDFFRTLYIPSDSRWGYWDQLHPKLSLASLVGSDWYSLVGYRKEGLEYSSVDHLMHMFSRPDVDELLDQSGIKYVIVPIKDEANEEIFIFDYGPRGEFIRRVESLSFLMPLDIGTRELLIYENSNFHTLFNSTSENIQYELVSQFHYRIRVPKSDAPTIIHFSQAFHPSWKLRSGRVGWISPLVTRNYFEQTAIKTPAGLMEFTIPPRQELVSVYFAPQAFTNLGSLLSLLVLGSSIAVVFKLKK